jgi:iron complex outermembrane receptor protein
MLNTRSSRLRALRNNAFFGVVNIITKGTDKLHGLQVRASADSDRTREVRASVGHRSEQGWKPRSD